MSKKKLFIIPLVLLMSLALLISATFAWFTMSRAPEISGITTQVGANGSLEIALLNNDTFMDPSSIKSGIGSSAASTTVQQSNITWGNVVDLSSDSYGLDKVTLKPARLNLTAGEDNEYVVNGNLLSVPTYNVDGRLQNFYTDTITAAFKGYDFTYYPDENGYGVRGIGSIQELSPQQSAFTNARSLVPSYQVAARSAIEAIWNANGAKLFDIAYRRGIGETSFTRSDTALLRDTAERLQSALTYMDAAVRQSAIGFAATQEESYSIFKDLKSDIEKAEILSDALLARTYFPSYILDAAAKLENAQSLVESALDEYSNLMWQESYTWSEINALYRYVIHPETTYINDVTFYDVNAETLILADSTITLTESSGAFYDAAVLLGEYDVLFSYSDDTVMQVRTLNSETALLENVTTYLKSSTAKGDYALKAVSLDEVYGYALDFAFRTNAKSNLQLQTSAKPIVESGSENEAQIEGNGSYMRFSSSYLNSDQVKMMMNAIRVGFLDNRSALVGVAKLGEVYDEGDNTYAASLYMHEYTVNEDGSITMGYNYGSGATIMPLEKNVATVLSVVVWLDGDYTDNSIASTMNYSLTGEMNLQFSSDAALNPAGTEEFIGESGNGGEGLPPEDIVVPNDPASSLKYQLYCIDDTNFLIESYDVDGNFEGSLNFSGTKTEDSVCVKDIQSTSNNRVAIPSVVNCVNDQKLYTMEIDYTTDLFNDVKAYVEDISLFSVSSKKIRCVNENNSLRNLFYCIESLQYIDISGLDTSNIVDMHTMFYGCKNLRSVELGDIDTSNVTNMYAMFYGCNNLNSVDVSRFNTSKVTYMAGMFGECWCLDKLDVSGFDTSNVISMYSMFLSCYELDSIDVSDFKTQNVTDMSSMFSSCYDLQSIDISGWDFVKVEDLDYFVRGSGLVEFNMPDWQLPNCTSMSDIFYECENLESVNIANLYVPNVTNMKEMFRSCYNITNINLTGVNTDRLENIHGMFYDCSSLETVDLTDLDVTNVIDMGSMFAESGVVTVDFSKKNLSHIASLGYVFYGCNKLESVNFSNNDFSNVTNVDSMFFGCYALEDVSFAGTKFSSLESSAYMFASSSVSEIDFTDADTSALKTTSYMFANYDGKYVSNAINFINFDTSNVTDMSFMFYNAQDLTTINLSDLNTSNVKYMNSMFYKCNDLTAATLNGLVTSATVNLEGMFKGCTKLVTVYTEGWNTQNVTNMSLMFNGCYSLTTVDLSQFNTSKVESMVAMFYNCQRLKTIDVSNFSVSNVSNMSRMFYDCSGATEIKLFDMHNSPNVSERHMSHMFYNCKSLTTLDLSGLDTSNVGTKTTYTYYGIDDSSYYDNDDVSYTSNGLSSMFNSCTSLTTIDLSPLDTSNVQTMASMFYGCKGLTSLDVSCLDTSSATDMGSMFYNCTSLSNLNLGNIDTSNVTNMTYMFYGCKGLANLNLSNFKTNSATDMSCMFYNCSGLTKLDLSNFNTANVTNMSYMFYNCTALTDINLSSFNTSKVSNMAYMFYKCSSLESVDVSGFDTSSVTGYTYSMYSNINDHRNTGMAYMFADCTALKTVDVSGWNVGNVRAMHGMFSGCTALTTVDVSKWNTSNVTTIGYMFYNCRSLKQLDVSGWNTSKVLYMNYAFYGCSSLDKLDISGWDFTAADEYGTSRESMFEGCSAVIITEKPTYEYKLVDNGGGTYSITGSADGSAYQLDVTATVNSSAKTLTINTFENYPTE